MNVTTRYTIASMFVNWCYTSDSIKFRGDRKSTPTIAAIYIYK